MLTLEWLNHTVPMPLWAVLSLAGYQVLTRLVRGEVRRRRGEPAE